MSHPLYDVTEFEIIGEYTLRVVFDDQTEQVINFEPVLFGEMYGPLRDIVLFNQVQLDKEVGTLTWPNGADFDPWMLHEWPKHVENLSTQAQSWPKQEIKKPLQMITETAPDYQVEHRPDESFNPQFDVLTTEKREKAAYLKLFPKLKEEFPGKFVAIYQESLVDSDKDFGTLFERIDTKYPDQFVWIAKVEDPPDLPLTVRSPRFEARG